MRVRISYGINIDDIPQELEQLFLHVEEKTQSLLRQVRQVHEFIADAEVESATNLIQKLRLNLAEIDNRAADIENIATGYVNYKENEGAEDVGEGRPSVDPTGNHPVSEPPEQPTGNPNRAEA